MNTIINKLFKSSKKNYNAEFLIDTEKIFDAVASIGKIIELPDNQIRGLNNIILDDRKGKVTVSFDNKRSRDIFVLGAKKYVDYRVIGVNYPY